MAELKNCPVCPRVNPAGALTCDCGFYFAAWEYAALPPPCQCCGARAETKRVLFLQNIGALVVRFQSRVEGQFCKSCIHVHFWRTTLTTFFLLGWWSAISFVVTPIVLMNNVWNYMRCLRMKRPVASAPGPGG